MSQPYTEEKLTGRNSSAKNTKLNEAGREVKNKIQ